MSSDPPPMEALFQVLWDAGFQPVGAPMQQGTGQPILQFTPQQVRRLLEVLSPQAVIALMHMIEVGYRPGRRVEIANYGKDWLKGRGMPSYAAQKANTELREKGYVRTPQMPGAAMGRQLGIVTGGFAAEDEEVPASLTHGRRRVRAIEGGGAIEPVEPGESRSSGAGEQQVGGVDGTSVNPTDGPVDNRERPVDGDSVYRAGTPVDSDERSVDGPSVNRGARQTVDRVSVEPNAQVSPVDRGSVALVSPAPTRREVGKEVLSLLDERAALPQAALHEFLAQPPLRYALSTDWETAVQVVGTAFARRPETCRRILGWLGQDEQVPYPSLTLAGYLVDLLAADGAQRIQAGEDLGQMLRGLNVRFSLRTPDETITSFVAVAIATLDTAAIDSLPGWVAAMMKPKAKLLPSDALTGALRALAALARGDLRPRTPAVEQEPTSPTERGGWLKRGGFSLPDTAAGPVVGQVVDGEGAVQAVWLSDSDVAAIVADMKFEPDYVRMLAAAARGVGDPFGEDAITLRQLLLKPERQQRILERWSQQQELG